jgi:hypothetical protein
LVKPPQRLPVMPFPCPAAGKAPMTFRKRGQPEQGQHRILDAVRIRWRDSRGHSGLRVISGGRGVEGAVTGKTAPKARFYGGNRLHNNVNSVSCSSFLRGKPSPRAYFVGRYPFQRGHPATPRAQDVRSFLDSPPAAASALPDSFLTMAGGLPAARDVRSTVPPLPVERRRRHEMPIADVPPRGHPGGISSLPVVSVSASLALAPCGAPVSDRGMCHSAQKIKGFPRVCRMRAATCIAVLPSVLGGSCLTALDLVLHALWLF